MRSWIAASPPRPPGWARCSTTPTSSRWHSRTTRTTGPSSTPRRTWRRCLPTSGASLSPVPHDLIPPSAQIPSAHRLRAAYQAARAIRDAHLTVAAARASYLRLPTDLVFDVDDLVAGEEVL